MPKAKTVGMQETPLVEGTGVVPCKLCTMVGSSFLVPGCGALCNSLALGTIATRSVWVRVTLGILSVECCMMLHTGGSFWDVMV